MAYKWVLLSSYPCTQSSLNFKIKRRLNFDFNWILTNVKWNFFIKILNFFPTANENVLPFQHCTSFILPSDFWLSIHNDRNCPILDNCDNKIIRISLYSFHFLRAVLPPRLLIYFKYNNHIGGTKLVSKEQRLIWWFFLSGKFWKSTHKFNKLFKSFLKPCFSRHLTTAGNL